VFSNEWISCYIRQGSLLAKKKRSRNAADGRVRMHLAGGGTGRGLSVGPARRPAHAPSGLESANDLDNMLWLCLDGKRWEKKSHQSL
jgi:hypothetical protein